MKRIFLALATVALSACGFVDWPMIPAVFVVIAVGAWLITSNIRLRLRVKELEKENKQLEVFAEDASNRYLKFNE